MGSGNKPAISEQAPQLAARYRLGNEIGRGGFGTAYLAHDEQLHDKQVVVKVLHERLSNDLAVRTFDAELRALARINHPGVVPILDCGLMPDGRFGLVLQYVNGVTLRSVLLGDGLELARVGPLLHQLGRAVTAAHTYGVVHRDLKPENILLHRNGVETPVIIDFGIATVLDIDPISTTNRGRGTVQYMAPEQLLGQSGPASDIFALGVIAFEMVTGRLPFEAITGAAMYVQQQRGLKIKPRTLRPELPAAAEDCILRALSFRPEDRYVKASDFGTEIVSALLARPFEGPAAHGASSGLRMAAVLFIDIVDYSENLIGRQTALVSLMQESVRQTPTFQRTQKAGELISLPTGDGVALVFLSNPIDPVECALEIAGRVRSRPDLKIRMGVNTGPIHRVSDINGNVNVTGGAINIAQRIMDCGDAGHILLSSSVAETLNQVSDTWVEKLYDLGASLVKHERELHLFNLYTGEAGNPSVPSKLRKNRESGSLLTVLTPHTAPSAVVDPPAPSGFEAIGHEREKAGLRDALAQAAGGRGLVLTLSGEPGAGKTTLVEGMLEEIRRSGARSYLATGRCSERLVGAGAWLPILEALDAAISSSREVARMVENVAPNWLQLVAPARAKKSRSQGRPAGGSEELLKREFFQLLAELSLLQPCVLFLDDIHWADLSTVDLLSYVGLRVGSLRLLVVCTYRLTDLLLSDHPFAKVESELLMRGLCRNIAVGLLDTEDISEYLERTYPGHRFPPELPELLYNTTEGNPFFLSALTKELQDRRVLALRDGRWTMAKSVTGTENMLPQSVRSMLEAKIKRLDERDRRLLEMAAIKGHEFDPRVLSAALSLDPIEVEDRLAVLERVHMLVKGPDARALEDQGGAPKYCFVHSLYQNAFLNGLGPARRAQLSGMVARALTDFGEERPTAQASSKLAVLYEMAQQPLEAARYFLRAAQQAASAYASNSAIELARRGLAALAKAPDSPERASLELQMQITLGGPLSAARGYGSAEVASVYQRAGELIQQMGDYQAKLPVLSALGAYRLMRGELQMSIGALDQLKLETRLASDPHFHVWENFTRGTVLSHLGRMPEALHHCQASVAHYRPQQHTYFASLFGLDVGVMAQLQEARVLWILGRPEAALTTVDRALTVARELGHPATRAYALFFASWVHYFRDEPQETLERSEEALCYSRENGIQIVDVWATSLNGWAHVRMGDSVQGMATLQSALDGQAAMQVRLLRPHFLGLLGEAMAGTGRRERAWELFTAALSESEETGDRWFTPELLRFRAQVARDAAAGERDLREAAEAARQQGARTFEMRALVALMGTGARNDPALRSRLENLYADAPERLGLADGIKAEEALQADG